MVVIVVEVHQEKVEENGVMHSHEHNQQIHHDFVVEVYHLIV